MSETLYLAPPIVSEAGPVMQQVTEKLSLQAAQKDLRGKARDRSTSEGVLASTLERGD
jgi:hypothetical protein